jgi:hypothetical protein
VGSAKINPLAQTITVIDNSDANVVTITSYYSYTVVPEPSMALLMGGGLVAIAMLRRDRRS